MDNSLVPIDEQDLQHAGQIAMVTNALARGRTITQACKEAGIGVSTWKRWRADGLVQQALADKTEDILSGARSELADAVAPALHVLVALAKGQIPRNTAITGTLAPRDVIAAQTQLFTLMKQLGLGESEKERGISLDDLQAAAINITTVHIETMNVGTEAQPTPIPSGVRGEIIEGEFHE